MPSGPDTELIAGIVEALRSAARPADAAPMQAYMKSAMPYYGVRLPAVRRMTRDLSRGRPLTDGRVWEATIRALYDEATHREERYAALAIAGDPRYRELATGPSLDLWAHLIVTGAWWDLVDETAHRVGDVLRAHRTSTTPAMRAWSRHDDLWQRRTSIICQLGHGRDVDTTLLTEVIDANISDRDFFIRKAIGWALREVARNDPAWVWDFVAARSDTLSALSKREALKHLSARPYHGELVET